MQLLPMLQEILVVQEVVDLFSRLEIVQRVQLELVVKVIPVEQVILLSLQEQTELDQAAEVELEEQEAMPLQQDRIQHQERAELAQT